MVSSRPKPLLPFVPRRSLLARIARIVTLALPAHLVSMAVCGWAISPAVAGPNANGVLVVHDVGIVASGCPETVPVPYCADVDNQVDALQTPVCWRVYAAFPETSSPRLKSLSWGTTFNSQIHVTWGSLPDPVLDFELPQGGWPGTSGCSIGESFGNTQTGQMVCCYWFSGYADSPGEWRTAPHVVQASIFVDDSEPPQVDMITNFGSLGFGTPGYTPCQFNEPIACCLAGGACQVMLPADCSAAGGISYGTVSCVPSPCPELGACCFPSGSCLAEGELACTQMGGAWSGAGTPCDPNPCPQIWGACCANSGACSVTSDQVCASAGGTWLGEGTDCDPNPCPQPPPPVAACCFFGTGNCLPLTEASCDSAGGYWWYWHPDCDPNPCPQPPPPSGACCYPDGHCHVQSASSCAGDGGAYLGDGTGCWPTNPCPQVYGACCFADGGCGIYPEYRCPQLGGVWQGEGTACDPNPCPLPGGPNAGGVLVVHDCGIAYTDDVSQYPSDPPASCDAVDAVAPADSLIVWKVYAAFPIAEDPRLAALSFGESFTAGAVTVLGEGLPGIGDTQIGQDGWPATPGGGVRISFAVTQTGPIAEICWFGGYGAAGSSWSAAPHPTLATVFFDDSTPALQDQIAGLGSIGFGTPGSVPCSISPLPAACCFGDGSCRVLTAEECGVAGGTYHGGSCTSNPCPMPPPGACCLPGGACQNLTPAECTQQHGQFMGSGTICAPNICTGTPVQRMSWGRVKHLYR